MRNWFKNNWLYCLLLTILILIVYGNSLNNVFLSDDLAEIVNNPNIGNPGYNLGAHPFGFIRLIFYWLAFQLGGLNPILFRSINIFFHIGSVFLIYGILSVLYSKRLAIIVATVFAVHPAVSEAVVWISGGAYPQYTFFFLLSFLLYILSRGKKKYHSLSIISYLFSFMSHPQMPLSLFLIFPLWEISLGSLKRNWLKTIPFLILSVVYMLITLNALPERTNTLQTVNYQERGVDNPLMLIPVAISSYFELIFWPKVLTLYHSELSFSPIQFAVRIIITLFYFVITFITLKKSKQIFFWLSFFFVALLPTLTPFRLNWVVAERYLYLPIIGIIIPLVFLFQYLAKKIKVKQLDLIIVSIIVLILSARTIIRNIDWKNEDNLWIATGKTSPSSPNTHNNLGDVYGRHGDKEAALREFQTAIAIKPNYADAYHNLANTYRELNQTDKALENYQKAIQFNPNLWQSYQNIAAIYYQNKQYNKALEYLQKGIAINPNNLNLRIALGVVYLGKGEKDKAKEVFNLILSVDPQNQFARAGLVEANK